MSRKNGLSTAAKIGLLALAVQGFEVSARGQAVGFMPIPAPLPSGAMLDVTPAVSADRRYVRMTLGVSFNEIIGFTTLPGPGRGERRWRRHERADRGAPWRRGLRWGRRTR